MIPRHFLTAAFTVGAFAPALALAQPAADRDAATALAAIERSLVELIAGAEPSVVAIARSAPKPQPLIQQDLGDAFGEFRRAARREEAATIVGAGVLIDRAGLVLTQYLAVREDQAHTVTTMDGRKYSAAIRGADPRSGLAVLKIETTAQAPPGAAETGPASPGSFPAIRLGDASALRKGQLVVAIGNPYAIASDGQPTASWGIVTNLARKAPAGTNFNNAPGPHDDYRTTVHHLGTLIQTDARLGWSAGGAALVNLRGELVGVTTTAATIAGHEQPAGYAIPINRLMRRVIDALQEGREVEYGMLGVGFGQAIVDTTRPGRAPLGIAQVYPGGPAAASGLQVGDVISRVGEKPVDDIDEVQLAVSSLPPATTTTIEYDRSGSTATTTVTLAKLGVAGKKIATERREAWRGLRVDYPTALDAGRFTEAIASGAYDAEGCVLVAEVEPHSAAWQAGVRPGMFISHVGGKRVSTPQEFRAAARGVVNSELDIRLTQPAASQEASDRGLESK